MKKTILVTGGAGFIGAHFVLRISKLNWQVIVLDNFSQSRYNILKLDNVNYIEADLKNYEEIERIFAENKVDVVAHFAALASVPDSVINPSGYYENNVCGGLNLLRAMIKHDVKYIINSSSASIYGEPQNEYISEDDQKIPTNPYGYTKLVFEEMLKDFHHAYGLNSISFRYLCASGCDESGLIGEYHNPETHVIPCLLNTALGKRKEFFVYGNDYLTPDGSGIRDYVHVNDLADAHLLAIDKLMKGEPISTAYNVGTNKGFSVFELIKSAEKITGKKINYLIKGRREGDPSRLIANSQKIQTELGWKPKYLNVDVIISTAYNFFSKL